MTGEVALLPDAPGWTMEFVQPAIPAEFLEQWPDALEVALVMGGLYWHQLAVIIEGTSEPSESAAHNINVIYCALLEWRAQQALMG